MKTYIPVLRNVFGCGNFTASSLRRPVRIFCHLKKKQFRDVFVSDVIVRVCVRVQISLTGISSSKTRRTLTVFYLFLRSVDCDLV